jgi:hypothetical protein
MPPSNIGSPDSAKDKTDKLNKPPISCPRPAGTLRRGLANPNMPLLKVHVSRQNALAQEADDLWVTLGEACENVDAVKDSQSPEVIRKILGKPTISGLKKTLPNLAAQTEEFKDSWLRLKEHREVLPQQVGVTAPILQEVDEGMEEIERMIVVFDQCIAYAQSQLKEKLDR